MLITSRRRLAALDDAAVITLDPLAPGEAAALLARLATRPTIHPDDSAIHQIARLCGYLPLAIGMLASQLRHHPAWTPAELAASLAAARDRLELMNAENLSVAAAFGLSYTDPSQEQQRLFRRLGLIPGPTFDAHAAATLDDTSLETARRCWPGCMTSTCSPSQHLAGTRAMYPVELILTALAAGVTSGVTRAASSAVQDAYSALCALVRKRLAGRPKASSCWLSTPMPRTPGEHRWQRSWPRRAPAVTPISSRRHRLS